MRDEENRKNKTLKNNNFLKGFNKVLKSFIYSVGNVVISFIISITLFMPIIYGGSISYSNVEDFIGSNTLWTIDNIRFDNEVSPVNVENFSNNLTKDCEDDFSERYQARCKVEKFSNYALNEIEYEGKYTGTPNPKTVLERGKARCLGKAILFVSLLETIQGNITIEPYFVYQPNHICVYYEYEGKKSIDGKNNFWNCGDSQIQYISKVNN